MERESESTTMSGSNRHNPSDQHLKQLNRISQKISKPPVATAKVPLRHQPPPAVPQQQHQVYNIDKTEFKDVVQRLTGSPASPAPPPKPLSSRLQSIRPPPLPHLTSSPPPPINYTHNTNATDSFAQKVHSTAESPVSAYMRYLQSSTPNPTPNFAMPTWQNAAGVPSSTFMMPNSPLGFGQVLSPRSPQYTFLSPSSFFSPTTGQWGFPQFSQSPKLSALSPR